MLKKTLRNEKGFTLIEIIAVLVILGVLAAVAVPKYLDLMNEARIKSAQGAIGEVKGRLATSQAKYMLNSGGTPPTGAALFTYASGVSGYGTEANLSNVGLDFNVLTTTGNPILISVDTVQNTTLSNVIVGNFKAAGD
jgi:prepilin-type N-terminal cleavage/methylation domain-containing protein